MPRKPALSESSFLAAVFSPKKNPVPSGLKRRKLTGTKGRVARRVSAFNAMSTFNQHILDRAGKREAYLRGEATLADAKRELRPRAVELQIAKPLRPRGERQAVGRPATDPRDRALSHIYTQLTIAPTKGKVSLTALRKNTRFLTADQVSRALKMDGPAIQQAGTSPDEIVDYDGYRVNPFWYH